MSLPENRAFDEAGNGNQLSNSVEVEYIDFEPPINEYCESFGSSTRNTWIENVTLGSLNNTSGQEGYGDFTNLSTPLIESSTYELQLTPGYRNIEFTVFWRVWIDYNRDGDFIDPNELIYEAAANGPIVTALTINNNLNVGPTRMRVSVKLGNHPEACGTIQSGEVEDYTVDLSSASSNARSILALNAFKENRQVKLNWIIENQKLTKAFIIERSINGVDYQTLEELNVNHTSAYASDYETKDYDPLKGDNYYRVKQLLDDGSILYSNQQKVNFDLELKDFELFPNPNSGVSFLKLPREETDHLNLFLYNQFGQLVMEKFVPEDSKRTIPLDFNTLQNGVYYLRIDRKGKPSKQHKIIVSRMY